MALFIIMKKHSEDQYSGVFVEEGRISIERGKQNPQWIDAWVFKLLILVHARNYQNIL